MPKPLRYAGDPDNIMLGGVFVRADAIAQSDVVMALRRFWTAAGAREAEPNPGVESGAFKREGLVGFAVLPSAADVDGVPWVGIRDSVHYSKRDWVEELGEALHEYLSTETFAFNIGPKTRLVAIGESSWFGVAKKSMKQRPKAVSETDRFPHAFVTYEEASRLEGASFLRFVIDQKVLHTLEFEKKFWSRTLSAR